jgi:L-Ala-D/L-Glu epimerase
MEIESQLIETPYRTGRFAIAGLSGDTSRSVLVLLHDGHGHWGLGEAVPSKRVLGVDESDIQRRLEAYQPLLRDLVIDPDGPPPVVPDDGRWGGLRGPVACALDGALLDAWARAKQMPVWQALDLPRPSMVTTSTVSIGTPEQMVKEALFLREAGFRHLKVKLGEGADMDAVRLGAVRDAVPDARLRIDANEGWSRKEAIQVAGTLADLGVEVVEQPLARDASVEDHHAVNRALEEHELPHVLDEAVHSAEDAERVARGKLAHGVNLKLQKAGGLREGLRLIETARAGGLSAMVGCFIESWAGISLALQAVGRLDWADLDGAWLLAEEPVVPVSPLLKEGVVEAGSARGLGLRLPEVFEGRTGGTGAKS